MALTGNAAAFFATLRRSAAAFHSTLPRNAAAFLAALPGDLRRHFSATLTRTAFLVRGEH